MHRPSIMRIAVAAGVCAIVIVFAGFCIFVALVTLRLVPFP